MPDLQEIISRVKFEHPYYRADHDSPIKYNTSFLRTVALYRSMGYTNDDIARFLECPGNVMCVYLGGDY